MSRLYVIELTDQWFHSDDSDFAEYKKVSEWTKQNNHKEVKRWLLDQVEKENITINGFYSKEVSDEIS